MTDLSAALSTTQPTNTRLHLLLLPPLTRLACGDASILRQARQLLQRLQRAVPVPDGRIALELARQLLLAGDAEVCLFSVCDVLAHLQAFVSRLPSWDVVSHRCWRSAREVPRMLACHRIQPYRKRWRC